MPKKETKARRALLDSAILLLAGNPGASIMEIAENAGIGRATLYRHFPTREDLIRTLSLEAIEAIDEVSDQVVKQTSSPMKMLLLSLEAIIPLGDRYNFLIHLPDIDDPEIKQKLLQHEEDLAYLIRAAQKEGEISRSIPVVWGCSMYNAILYAAWEVLNEGRMTSEEIILHATNSFKRAINV